MRNDKIGKKGFFICMPDLGKKGTIQGQNTLFFGGVVPVYCFF